jgi:hypothetical protein
MPSLSLDPSPTTPRSEFRPQDRSRLSVSTGRGFAWQSYPGSGAVSDPSMTSASTATSEPLSRSTTNEMLIGPLEMCSVGAQYSNGDFSEALSMKHELSSSDVDSLFPGLFDSSTLNNMSDNSFSSGSQSQDLPRSFFPGSVDMLHSFSKESNASSSSSDSSLSRQARRVQERNTYSNRLLAPKIQPQQVEVAEPETNFIEVIAEDGTRRKKAPISRCTRQPKESNKVYCEICTDHREGFHGEHELRRHIDRTHKGLRKVWVCKDISPDRTMLANCKHCRTMKTYGANYNAAAHLRRVHFNPCITPKGGRGKVSQNRGGIGGGNEPSMAVLREWMVEMWETNENGLLFDDLPSHEPPCSSAPSSSNQLSSSYSDHLILGNEAVQISDADFDFVQQSFQLDMSFLRDSTLLEPAQPDLPFFDPSLNET